MSNHRRSERPTLHQYPLLPTKVTVYPDASSSASTANFCRDALVLTDSVSSKKLLAHQAQINGRSYVLNTAGFIVLT
jgi:hypothetical protein